MPNALKGGHNKTKEGHNICFSYNLGTCQVKSGTCPKGSHVCAYCEDIHPFTSCTKKN
jgi:hypothetical protein